MLILLIFPGSLPRLRARLLGLRRPRGRQPREELEALRRQLGLAQPPARDLAQRRHGRRGRLFPEFEPPLFPEFGLAAADGLCQPLVAGVIVQDEEEDCFQKEKIHRGNVQSIIGENSHSTSLL